jgi:hypothetical protein
MPRLKHLAIPYLVFVLASSLVAGAPGSVARLVALVWGTPLSDG